MLFLAFVLFAFTTPSYAATYYVDDSLGSDSNNGSSGSPYKTINRGTQSPTAPGDTIIVRSGTYTASDIGRSDKAVYIIASLGSVAGTSAAPITIRSETPQGAQIKIPSLDSGTHGIDISQPYYIIEGFDINSVGVTQNTGLSNATAAIIINASNTTIRRNYIRDVSRTMCSNSAFSHQGISLTNGVQNTLIEYNTFARIGRRLNGESGCVTDKYQHDHGIYSKGADFVTIRYNQFYQTDRGFVIQLFTTGATHDHISIVHNSIDGGSPDTRLSGTMVLCNTLSNIDIKNNVIRNPAHGYMVSWCSGTTATNMFVRNNASNTHDESGTVDFLNPGSLPSSGITVSGTLPDKTLGWASTTTDAEDFTLTSSSTALIDAGTDISLAYNGSAPDIGAFETFTFSSCTATAATKIQGTFTNNLNPPLLPVSGITTFTARKNGANNVLSGLPVTVADNIVEITTTNSYAGGDTVDISWTSGNITDSSKVGGVLNQPYLVTLTNQSCTNNLTGPGPTYTLTQAAFEWHDAYGTESSPIILPLGFASTGAAENLSITYPVYPGSKWRTRFSIVCGVATCPDDAYVLKYSRNGGSYTTIPDTAGSDGISFCGIIATNPANGAATTNQLSTSGTFRAGGVIYTSNAIPTVVGLTAGDKTENEYCVALSTSASGTFAFRVYTQTGSALTSYTYTPQVSVGTASFGGP